MIDLLDRYRAEYDTMSIEEHQRVYDRIAADYPNQHYYDSALVREFFRYAAHPLTVVELGGWDGELASERPGVVSWVNFEIADVQQVCRREGYVKVSDEWFWRRPRVAGAFVASHSLEHLSELHLIEVVETARCRWAYVDVPLSHERNTWQGSSTTHKLQLSIEEFDQLWQSYGWIIDKRIERGGDVPSHVRFMRHG